MDDFDVFCARARGLDSELALQLTQRRSPTAPTSDRHGQQRPHRTSTDSAALSRRSVKSQHQHQQLHDDQFSEQEADGPPDEERVSRSSRTTDSGDGGDEFPENGVGVDHRWRTATDRSHRHGIRWTPAADEQPTRAMQRTRTMPARRRMSLHRNDQVPDVDDTAAGNVSAGTANRRTNHSQPLANDETVLSSGVTSLKATTSGTTTATDVETTSSWMVTSKSSLKVTMSATPSAVTSDGDCRVYRMRSFYTKSGNIVNRGDTVKVHSGGRRMGSSFKSEVSGAGETRREMIRLGGRSNNALTEMEAKSPAEPRTSSDSQIKTSSGTLCHRNLGERCNNEAHPEFCHQSTSGFEPLSVTHLSVSCPTGLPPTGGRLVEGRRERFLARRVAARSVSINEQGEEEEAKVYKVHVLGGPGVGKTTLTRQLLTSEYLANKESFTGEISNKNVIFLEVHIYEENLKVSFKTLKIKDYLSA